jgi:predicted amidophosphoribosyltransferase
MTLLCKGCDSIRDTERSFCSSCNEQTDSYVFDPHNHEGEVVFTRAMMARQYMREGSSRGYFDLREKMGRAA